MALEVVQLYDRPDRLGFSSERGSGARGACMWGLAMCRAHLCVRLGSVAVTLLANAPATAV